MSFPVSPADGQIDGKYIYSSSKGAWEKLGDIVSSGSNHIKYTNGILIQWGSKNTTGSTWVEVNLPIAYINNAFIDTVSPAGGGSGTAITYNNATYKNTTKFTIWCDASGAVNWHTIGEWK